MPAVPADPDNDGYDTDDEEPYGHDGMIMQQDDLDIGLQ
jgi:hypothetical protein